MTKLLSVRRITWLNNFDNFLDFIMKDCQNWKMVQPNSSETASSGVL